MSTATEHARTLLAAIIPDRADLLDKARRHLSPDHFPDAVLCNLFIMCERYADATGGRGVLRRESLVDQLCAARADPGKVALYVETYDLLASRTADDADFRWSLEQVRELAADRATGEAITQAMEILTRGAQGERGEQLRGHTDARTHLLQRFAEIDRDLSMQESPEGDVRAEGEQFLAAYADGEAALRHGRRPGIDFGIPTLDAKLNGLQRGELVLIVGYTSEGKTHVGVQLAWHAAVRQGRNVVFLTTETVRETVRRRLVARHSCLEHFDIPGGLNSRDLKNFTLSSQEKQHLYRVVTDLTTNSGYGRLWIAQVPRGATLAHIESRLHRIQRMFHVDLVIVDSLYLLRPEKRRNTDREELSGILKESTQLATTFNDGLGIPLVSPWQVSRTARQNAEIRGYTSDALSETAEASNSADIIVSILAPNDTDSRTVNLRMQVMKNRDGERATPFEVAIDYATSRLSAPAGNRSELDQMFTGQLYGV